MKGVGEGGEEEDKCCEASEHCSSRYVENVYTIAICKRKEKNKRREKARKKERKPEQRRKASNAMQ